MMQKGKTIVWGVRDLKPIRTDIVGRQRLRMRRKNEAQLFIKTATGVRGFYLREDNGHWVPEIEFGRNVRLSSPDTRHSSP